VWDRFHRLQAGRIPCDGEGLCGHFGIKLPKKLDREALEWSTNSRRSRFGAAVAGNSAELWGEALG